MYTISFELAALILTLTCLIYSLTVKRRQYMVRGSLGTLLQNQHFVFLLLLLSNLLSAASSVGGVFLQTIASEQVVGFQYLLHELYFVFHSTLSICFSLYIMNVNGTSVGRSKLFYFLFVLPYLLAELLILTNRFTSLAFYMDENFIYHRGPLMPVLYAIGALYIILGLVFFLRYSEAISRVDRYAIAVVILTAALGIVVQALHPQLLVELFAEALAFLMLMVLLEEKSGHIDPVTGALNRLAFTDANRRLIQTGQHYGIVLIKLTNLELYSRLFGGREMESLLVQIVAWLTSVSSPQDCFSYGQEQFAVLVMDPAPEAADRMAETILERFGQDWHIRAMTLRLEVAVAVAHVPEEIDTLEQIEELLASSYQKREAGSHMLAYDEIASLRQTRSTELALRRAIENGALRVWYQPIWSAEKQRTVAAEALLRIDDDEFRGVSPEVYIPIAEKSGLIQEIGSYVFSEVCRFLAQNGEKAPQLEYLELNLSLYQFLYDDVVAHFEQLRSVYRVPTEKLNLEITESASDSSAAGVLESIQRFRTLGYTFSLDDFGTGYSNLNRLISRNFLNVKIDKSLLWDADRNEDTRRLLESMMRIIHTLGCHIVQEGVETPEQLEQVTNFGCDLIQGYYFSRPLPEQEFLQYLQAEWEKITIDSAKAR